ncbi:helix-turn-helix domain-containing protein [Schaalia naturae]|uniref:Helix-turn-helix domain-containing protein n=2 Tax=Schaalia naturae TaxID=635203 RepID=A0ABW2SPY7_9ACTO
MQLCEVIGTGRAAEIVGVSRDTIRRWAKSGRLRHILLPSGQMRFYEADIEALLRPVEMGLSGERWIWDWPDRKEGL